MYYERDEDENSMSSDPFTLTSSTWNRNSSSTFLRRRTNKASISGDWPSTGAYISNCDHHAITMIDIISFLSSLRILVHWDVPSMMVATLLARSPKRGSAMYLTSSCSIGSSRTSSRPASAMRKPSRCTSSCISEKAVVGGTFCIAHS